MEFLTVTTDQQRSLQKFTAEMRDHLADVVVNKPSKVIAETSLPPVAEETAGNPGQPGQIAENLPQVAAVEEQFSNDQLPAAKPGQEETAGESTLQLEERKPVVENPTVEKPEEEIDPEWLTDPDKFFEGVDEESLRKLKSYGTRSLPSKPYTDGIKECLQHYAPKNQRVNKLDSAFWLHGSANDLTLLIKKAVTNKMLSTDDLGSPYEQAAEEYDRLEDEMLKVPTEDRSYFNHTHKDVYARVLAVGREVLQRKFPAQVEAKGGQPEQPELITENLPMDRQGDEQPSKDHLPAAESGQKETDKKVDKPWLDHEKFGANLDEDNVPARVLTLINWVRESLETAENNGGNGQKKNQRLSVCAAKARQLLSESGLVGDNEELEEMVRKSQEIGEIINNPKTTNARIQQMYDENVALNEEILREAHQRLVNKFGKREQAENQSEPAKTNPVLKQSDSEPAPEVAEKTVEEQQEYEWLKEPDKFFDGVNVAGLGNLGRVSGGASFTERILDSLDSHRDQGERVDYYWLHTGSYWMISLIKVTFSDLEQLGKEGKELKDKIEKWNSVEQSRYESSKAVRENERFDEKNKEIYFEVLALGREILQRKFPAPVETKSNESIPEQNIDQPASPDSGIA